MPSEKREIGLCGSFDRPAAASRAARPGVSRVAQLYAFALPSLMRVSPSSVPTSARGDARSWSAPTCQCFLLCSTGEVLRLFERLPLVINNTASPWYSYLTAVYGGPVQLPFDPRRLQMFYPGLLPTNSHLCRRSPITGLPVGVPFKKGHPPLTQCAPGVQSSLVSRVQTPGADLLQCAPEERLPQCAPAECVGWMRPPEEAYVSFDHKKGVPTRFRDPRYRLGWAAKSSHIWTPVQEPWAAEGSLSRGESLSRLQLAANHLFVGMQPQHRRFYPNHTWVEVIRVGQGIQSSSSIRPFYGCWFWPLVGSGVWVNVGRTLAIVSPHGAGAEARHDQLFANVTVKRGFDSMQVMKGQQNYGGSKQRYHMLTGPTMELILASGQCHSAANFERGACVPVPLRAGLHAEQPCECSEDAAPFINCRQAFLRKG